MFFMLTMSIGLLSGGFILACNKDQSTYLINANNNTEHQALLHYIRAGVVRWCQETTPENLTNPQVPYVTNALLALDTLFSCEKITDINKNYSKHIVAYVQENILPKSDMELKDLFKKTNAEWDTFLQYIMVQLPNSNDKKYIFLNKLIERLNKIKNNNKKNIEILNNYVYKESYIDIAKTENSSTENSKNISDTKVFFENTGATKSEPGYNREISVLSKAVQYIMYIINWLNLC